MFCNGIAIYVLNYRLAGEWIPDQIVRSVATSKRTVVILSENFLDSLWGKVCQQYFIFIFQFFCCFDNFYIQLMTYF